MRALHISDIGRMTALFAIVLSIPSLWAAQPSGYVNFENLDTGEIANGGTNGGETDLEGNEWFEINDFQFADRRDIAEGGRMSGTFQNDRFRAIVPNNQGVTQLIQWKKDGKRVKVTINLFEQKLNQGCTGTTTGYLDEIKLNGNSASITFDSSSSSKSKEVFNNTYHNISCNDLIHDKSRQWESLTRSDK